MKKTRYNGITDIEERFNRVYSDCDYMRERRFRNCNADVGTTADGGFTYLRSYRTIVCIIDNRTGEAYDILRTVYGYTNTSGKQIKKFLDEYKPSAVYKTGCDEKSCYLEKVC